MPLNQHTPPVCPSVAILPAVWPDQQPARCGGLKTSPGPPSLLGMSPQRWSLQPAASCSVTIKKTTLLASLPDVIITD